MNKLKNNLTMLTYFLGGVAGHHYIGKALDYRSELAASQEMELKAISEAENMELVQKKLNLLMKNNETLSKIVETIMDKQDPESELTHVNELLDLGGKQCQIVREILDDNINLDFYQIAYRAAVACEKANRTASESVKGLVDSINGSNKLISDFNLDSFYTYLNSLSLLEVSVLYHSIILLSIGMFSFNILSAILGNEIINYLKLEEKFPKLAAFFRLRLKFQKYYLILNFTLIFISIIITILINMLILF